MLFVPDIFTLERMNGIEEISQYFDFDRWMLGNEKMLPNLHDFIAQNRCTKGKICDRF